MLLELIKRKNGRYLGHFKCDNCIKCFKRGIARCSSDHGHFCSRKCSSTNIDVISQKRQTTLKTYGVSTCMLLPNARQKAKQTCVTRYGVENPFQSHEIMSKVDLIASAQKIHATMKRNGTYAKKQSRVENVCFDALCELFGADNVERQALILRWPIDFYVKVLDAYIQIDGVYWHGLDRPIDLIAKGITERDVQIHHKWHTDRTQDEWFEQNNKRLIRFTDLEIQQWQKEKNLLTQLSTILQAIK